MGLNFGQTRKGVPQMNAEDVAVLDIIERISTGANCHVNEARTASIHTQILHIRTEARCGSGFVDSDRLG